MSGSKRVTEFGHRGYTVRKFNRLLAEWVTHIVEAGNLVVLKTPPGSANLVANALDAAQLEGVAGM